MSETTDKQALGSTWYVLRRWSSTVEEREVVKNTSATVWIRTLDWQGKPTGKIRQERRGNDWFPTKREALLELRRRLERNRQLAEAEYSRCTDRLKTFNLKYAGELG